MEKTYYTADNRKFIEAMNRYRIRYQAEGEAVDGEIEIKPSDDLMAFAKALNEVEDAINTGFEGLEGKLDRLAGFAGSGSGPDAFDYTSMAISLWGAKGTMLNDWKKISGKFDSLLTKEYIKAELALNDAGAAIAKAGSDFAHQVSDAGRGFVTAAHDALIKGGAKVTSAKASVIEKITAFAGTEAAITTGLVAIPALAIIAGAAIEHLSKEGLYDIDLENAQKKLAAGEELTQKEQLVLESEGAYDYYDKLTTKQEGQEVSIMPPKRSVYGADGGNDELMEWLDAAAQASKKEPDAAKIAKEYATGLPEVELPGEELPANPYMGADESMLLPQAEQEAFHEMTDEALGGVATPVTSNVVNNYNTTSEEGETQWKTFAPVIHMHGVTISSEYDIEEIGRRLADMLVSAVERGPH